MKRDLQALAAVARRSLDELKQHVVPRAVDQDRRTERTSSERPGGYRMANGNQAAKNTPDNVSSSSVKDDRPASPQGESSTENTLLSPLHNRWLERVFLHPEETINQRAAGEHLTVMEEWRIRTHLVRLGYAVLAGKIGKVEYWSVSEKGKHLMESRGLTSERWKSGILHEVCLRLIEEDVTRFPTIKATRGGAFDGIQPDVVLTSEAGGCVPVQVSVTNAAGYEAGCALRLAALVAITRVVVVCTTQEKVKAVQRALARAVAQHEEGMFGTPGSVAKVMVLHGEEVLQQRLDWLAISKGKAASQKQPDQQKGMRSGEAAAAGVGRPDLGHEGSQGWKEQGSQEISRPAGRERLAGGAEDGPGGEAVDEPEGPDEAGKEVQGLQEARKAGGDWKAGDGTARPRGRAETTSRGPGTDSGMDRGKDKGRGPGPEPEAREGADQQDRPRKPDDREGGRRNETRTRMGAGTAGAGTAEGGKVSSVEGLSRAGTGEDHSKTSNQPEAGESKRLGRRTRRIDRSRDQGPARQERDGERDNSGGEGAATIGGGLHMGGAANANDGRTTVTTTNVRQGSQALGKEAAITQGRNLNLKRESPILAEDRLLITFQEAADLCSVSQKTISRAVKAGYLQAIQAPGTRGTKGRRISRAELDSWQGRQALEAEKALKAVTGPRGPSGGR